MPINDPKSVTPEELANDIFKTIFGFTLPKAAEKDNPKTDTPVVDHVGEFTRLLKSAEAIASEDTLRSAAILQIADRHFRMIELAVSSQR